MVSVSRWCPTATEKIDPRVIYQDESQYCYIAVKQLSVIPDNRIFLQDTLMHSDIIMGDINDLQYEYTIIYAGVTRLLSKNKNKLNVMLLAAAATCFRDISRTIGPAAKSDVVEIDPAVTKGGR